MHKTLLAIEILLKLVAVLLGHHCWVLALLLKLVAVALISVVGK